MRLGRGCERAVSREDEELSRRLMAVVLVAGVCSALVACGSGGDARGSGGKVAVVATYSVLGDIVKNVGGEEISLSTLVGPNSDAHTFESAPSDNGKLAEAAVIFENGLEFEPWLDDLYESSRSEARRVVVTGNVEPLAAPEEKRASGEKDPHVWHDVANAMVITEAVREALIKADPDNEKAYRANAREYLSKLEELDAEVVERVESIPEDRRTLFTSHDTFGYFADRYGFEVDTALASVSTEASDPSAGETAALVEDIESSGVPAIFGENVSNPGLMQRIADEADVKLGPPLYTDALGEPDSAGGTYVEMERYNARKIAEALGR